MTEMTATERATHDRIMAAPPAEESVVEGVARAIAAADYANVAWESWPPYDRNAYRTRARAALAVMAGPDDTTRAVLGDENDTPVAVCCLHKRFAPCRDDSGDCDISTHPADVEHVRVYQFGGSR